MSAWAEDIWNARREPLRFPPLLPQVKDENALHLLHRPIHQVEFVLVRAVLPGLIKPSLLVLRVCRVVHRSVGLVPAREKTLAYLEAQRLELGVVTQVLDPPPPSLRHAYEAPTGRAFKAGTTSILPGVLGVTARADRREAAVLPQFGDVLEL